MKYKYKERLFETPQMACECGLSKGPCGRYAANVEKIWVSRDLAEELRKHPWCRVSDQAVPLKFFAGRSQLF